MFRDTTFIVLISIIIFLSLGWYRTFDDYNQKVDTLTFALKEWNKTISALDKMEAKYVETGNKLNNCMEQGNKVYN